MSSWRSNCLPGLKVNSQCSVLGRARRLWGTSKHILAPGDLEIDKSRCQNRGFELCLQQSARDSPGPQVDAAKGSFGYLPLDKDVCNLNSSSRFQHARHFFQGGRLVRH